MSKNFKEIKGYEDYLIYNDGRVYSKLKRIFLSQGIHSKGYKVVSLQKNKKGHTKTVHRLVAEAFVQNFHNKPQVNHINGIKDDNKFTNLEWCTNSENQKHAHFIGVKSVSDCHKESISISNSKPVLDLYTGIFYKNTRELSDILSLKENTLRSHITGSRRKSNRYIYA